MVELSVQKRVFIIHGWDGHPEDGWFPWLKSELEHKEYHVEVPEMPETETPVIRKWVSHLAEIVGEPDENTYFVGHSIGCQTILRYLETLPSTVKVGGAVFVAGWFTLMGLEDDEARQTAEPWLTIPIDFAHVTQHTKNFVAIFSDDDYFVPAENKELFEEKLQAKTRVEHTKGHFTGDDGVKELLAVLEEVVKL